MADSQQMTQSLLSALTLNIGDSGLNNKREITSMVLGTESMDAGRREIATTSLEQLEAIVMQTIETYISTESMSMDMFTPAQLMAAKKAASLALDPKAAIAGLSRLRSASSSQSDTIVEPMSLGIEDIVDPLSLSTEAFDGQSINNALYFSITYNLMAARQDAFGEAFFPTITIDPTISGMSIESEYISLYNEITRTVDGASDGKKFNKIPIVKAIYDNNLFSSDKNKAIPVSRAANAAVLVPELAYVDNSGSEAITTAPIKFGVKVSLLGLSQTDAMLSKGSMDNTDSLDRRVVLDKVYFSLTGVNGAAETVTETFSFNASVFPHSNFTHNTQDHNKDLSHSFTTESVYIKTGSTLTASGSPSAILAELTPNHTIGLRVVTHGDGNTQYGDVVIYGNAIEVISIADAAGNLLPSTGAEYLAILAAFTDKLKLVGYTLEAYRTNSNLRTRGQLITTDRYRQIYTVPLRSGITVLSPLNNETGNDNDASKINSQITYAGIRTSVHAVKTLVEYGETLHNITNNGATVNVTTMGVGRHHVSAYYSETNLPVAAYVDSIKSTDRLRDIQAVLVNHVKNEVLAMGIDSNYMVANNVLRGNVGGKINVIIGTDPKIAQYLTAGNSKIDLGDDFEATVVSTPNSLVKGKIYLTFGVFDGNRNTVPNPLNFGQCLWSPTITTDAVRSTNGATVRELTTMPRFLHVVNLPVMSVINVTDITLSLGKVALNFHTV